MVKDGYKQTDIGIIPNDWEVTDLNTLGNFSKGSGVKKDEAQSGNIPCIRYGEIYTHHNDYIKKFNSFISSEVSSTAKKIKNGDILFAGSGETKEDIGKCVAFIHNYEAYAGGDIVILSPKNIDSLYLGYALNTPNASKQKASKGQGDAVVHISANNLGNIIIPIPTKEEQKAIATVLSDTDELIAQLQKLISKKEDIKTATMQLLLTGKKRVDRFSDKWVEKKLGNICSNITTGKLDANAMVKDGDYRFYTCAREYYKINHYAFDDEALLVSGNGANVGYIHYYKGKFNAYQRTYVLTDFNEDIQFIKLYMEMYLANRIRTEVNSGNTPYITMDTLTDMVVVLPLSTKEQTAIATILSDMDKEIETLKSKLSKTKAIKEGMMSELLSGNTRLM